MTTVTKNQMQITSDMIAQKIYLIRGKKVMLDKDLAQMYHVSTKTLIQAVKRNLARFPSDFMYQIENKEVINLRSQIVTSSWGGRRYLPYAFTEQGVAMLSSVLKSERAIRVNIQIIRTFTKLRELLATNELIRQRIEELERKYERHDKQFKIIFDAIKGLLETPASKPRKPIGFHVKYD